MGAESSDNGSPVRGVSCTDPTARKVWIVPQAGHGNRGSIRVAFGTDGTAPVKCLDVTNGINANGTKLQLWDCTANNVNQNWFPNGVAIQWSGANGANPMCIDLTDGVIGNQVSAVCKVLSRR
ncbi:MAG TPA: ricin-type beta-trefoil lectin domain protein [Chlamydiales bacterium]|nr:ricin-type beta-trefoil lectin domain protein [Chlamydiales bacterium]